MDFEKTSTVKILLIIILTLTTLFLVLLIFLNSKDEDKNKPKSSTLDNKSKEQTIDRDQFFFRKIDDINEDDFFGHNNTKTLEENLKEKTHSTEQDNYSDSVGERTKKLVANQNKHTNQNNGSQSTIENPEQILREDTKENRQATDFIGGGKIRKEQTGQKLKNRQGNSSTKQIPQSNQEIISFKQNQIMYKSNNDDDVIDSKQREKKQKIINNSERDEGLKYQRISTSNKNSIQAEVEQINKNGIFVNYNPLEFQGTFEENIVKLIKKYNDYADHFKNESKSDLRINFTSKPPSGTSNDNLKPIDNALNIWNENNLWKKKHLNEIRMWGISKKEFYKDYNMNDSNFLSLLSKVTHALSSLIKNFVNEKEFRVKLKNNADSNKKFFISAFMVLDLLIVFKKSFDYGAFDGILNDEEYNEIVRYIREMNIMLQKENLESLVLEYFNNDQHMYELKKSLSQDTNTIDEILDLKNKNNQELNEIIKNNLQTSFPGSKITASRIKDIITHMASSLTDSIKDTNMKKLYHDFIIDYLTVLAEKGSILKEEPTENKNLKELDID